MKTIQIVSGVSMIYFLINCFTDTAEEARVEALMAIITMFLVFLIASHLHGIQKNDIADEIRENHKRSIASGNGVNIVQGTSNKASAKATK